MPTNAIEARGLSKRYGQTVALDGVSFHAAPGRIVGLIGPNGAGKTTALNAILGLIPADGELTVMGLDPYRDRGRLMEVTSFIADVAVLPRWLKVQQAMDFVAHVHPRFRPLHCAELINRFGLPRTARVASLSKGMVTQLHLALVMAIDAKLLVLDEPTLGLDIVSRKQFYDHLLNDYMDDERTILVTTHQVEEIENILTDVIFLERGKVVLDLAMDALADRFAQLVVGPEHVEAARRLKPLSERNSLGRTVFMLEGADPEALAALGDVRQPSLADLFVAKMTTRAV